MTPFRRALLIAGVLVVAGVLAFPLRDTIYDIIVIPLAFLGWQLGLFYRMLAQAIWWWLIIVLVFFLLFFSLLPRMETRRRRERKSSPPHGQVEDLSKWLARARNGVYFKWLIANRLGKLAYQILLHRESGRTRAVFDPLIGQDWEPPRELQTYLETGLHGSFSDYPSSAWLPGPAKQTPLDYDIQQAVEFLEAQVENGRLGVQPYV